MPEDTYDEGELRIVARAADVVRDLSFGERADLVGLPTGALAYLLARATREPASGPTVIVTRDTDHARKLAEDLRFFLVRDDGEEDEGLLDVLVYPPAETSPFLDVAPDRRAAMDRLGCL